ANLDLAQIHRPLQAADLEGAAAPIIAVVSVSGSVVAIPPTSLLRRCQWVLFDSSAGTGSRFDWWLLSGTKFDVPLYLAGGLDPDNVAEAIDSAHPDGVDIASGVERAAGVKDPEKMRRFFEAVREADSAGLSSGRRPG